MGVLGMGGAKSFGAARNHFTGNGVFCPVPLSSLNLQSYWEGNVRKIALSFFVVTMMHTGVGAESKSVCVAPVSWKPLPYSAPGLYCASEKVSLKIDAQVVPAPIEKDLRIADLEPTTRHRVVVLCDGKPQQSFTFRFSDFKASQLCLFLDEAYKTVQLRDAKECPWCKCK